MKQKSLNRLSVLALFACVALLTNCGDKEEEDPKTASEYLTSSKWVLDDMTSDDVSDASLTVYKAFFEDFEATYKADGTYETFAPAFGDLLGTDEGTWELSTDGKVLIHDKGTEFEEQLPIKKLDSSSLQYESTIEDDESGDSFIIVLKFKH